MQDAWRVTVAVDRPIDGFLHYRYHTAEAEYCGGTSSAVASATSSRSPRVGERVRVTLRGRNVLGIVVAYERLGSQPDPASPTPSSAASSVESSPAPLTAVSIAQQSGAGSKSSQGVASNVAHKLALQALPTLQPNSAEEPSANDPLGRSNRELPNLSPDRLDIAVALDTEPALNGAIVALALFVAQHYHQPPGPCLAAALPPAWRQTHEAPRLINAKTRRRARASILGFRQTPLGRSLLELMSNTPDDDNASEATRPAARPQSPSSDNDVTRASRGLTTKQHHLLNTIARRAALDPRGYAAIDGTPPSAPPIPCSTAAQAESWPPERSRIQRLVARGLIEVVTDDSDITAGDGLNGCHHEITANPTSKATSSGPESNTGRPPELTPAQRHIVDQLVALLPRSLDSAAAPTPPDDASIKAPSFEGASAGATTERTRDDRPSTAPPWPVHAHTVLLEGVTGSGKTRIYEEVIAALIAHAEKLGQPTPSVLVLTPEIGLAPQLVARLRNVFGHAVIESHSGQSASERARVFTAIRAGQARIVVGTRSAIFSPLKNLALIIVDEEHDGAFKQTQSPLYNARDLAVWRGRQAGALVILGSATPSLESLANAAAGRYRQLRLDQRPDGTAPPRIDIIDLRRHTPDEGLSTTLLHAISATLEREEHVFLLLNRRGYAPALLCTHCGWNAGCPRCDAHLTVHHGRTPHHAARQARLRCHHCGYGEHAPRNCPTCGTPLDARGLGTQRIERALAAHFPLNRVLRLDRDALAGPRDLARALARLRTERGLIVVGTQLISKGHDLPDVGLVGIVDADAGWYSADLRAAEHTAQQILQVAGRARRAPAPTPTQASTPAVLLQTWVPEHELVQALRDGRWPPIAAKLLAERQAAALPPFGRAALLRLDGINADDTTRAANDLAACLRSLASTAPSAATGAHSPPPSTNAHNVVPPPSSAGARHVGPSTPRVLGPAPALIARVHNRYREQILLLGPSHAALHPLLDEASSAFKALTSRRGVRLTVDVDPLSLA